MQESGPELVHLSPTQSLVPEDSVLHVGRCASEPLTCAVELTAGEHRQVHLGEVAGGKPQTGLHSAFLSGDRGGGLPSSKRHNGAGSAGFCVGTQFWNKCPQDSAP